MSLRVSLQRARLSVIACAALAIAMTPVSVAAAAVETRAEDVRYLRVVEQPGQTLALEVGVWTFRPAEGEGPDVGLISVAHIGDPILYSRLQAILSRYDLVLYESVRPAGAARPRGADDAERAEATRAALRFVAQMVHKHQRHTDALPQTTDELLAGLATIDPRLSQWTESALVDAWGRHVIYALDASRTTFEVASLGADGAQGGDGANADIIVDGSADIEAFTLNDEDNLQQQLADALGLAFQLKAMDYSGENWRCSDMTADQLSRAFAARGLNFADIGSTLAGTSFPAQMVKMLMRLIRMLDAMGDGMMSDMMKIMMIDVLGDHSITESALNNQFGAGFAEVIVGDRNQVVMDDLREVLEDEPDHASIAIFYGAAHMPDFEKRLKDQFNYVPAEVIWVPAIIVDMRQTALPQEQIQRIRRMVRMGLQGMR